MLTIIGILAKIYITNIIGSPTTKGTIRNGRLIKTNIIGTTIIPFELIKNVLSSGWVKFKWGSWLIFLIFSKLLLYDWGWIFITPGCPDKLVKGNPYAGR